MGFYHSWPVCIWWWGKLLKKNDYFRWGLSTKDILPGIYLKMHMGMSIFFSPQKAGFYYANFARQNLVAAEKKIPVFKLNDFIGISFIWSVPKRLIMKLFAFCQNSNYRQWWVYKLRQQLIGPEFYTEDSGKHSCSKAALQCFPL